MALHLVFVLWCRVPWGLDFFFSLRGFSIPFICSEASFLYIRAVFPQPLFREEGSSVQPIVTHLHFMIYQTDFKTHLSTVNAKTLLVISTGNIGGAAVTGSVYTPDGNQHESTPSLHLQGQRGPEWTATTGDCQVVSSAYMLAKASSLALERHYPACCSFGLA